MCHLWTDLKKNVLLIMRNEHLADTCQSLSRTNLTGAKSSVYDRRLQCDQPVVDCSIQISHLSIVWIMWESVSIRMPKVGDLSGHSEKEPWTDLKPHNSTQILVSVCVQYIALYNIYVFKGHGVLVFCALVFCT